MKKISILFASTILLIYSCKKDKDAAPISEYSHPPECAKYHFPLSIGSYWIYESITIDSNSNVISTSGIDSVYISRDTVINGKTYVIKERTTLSGGGYYLFYTETIRDSAGYVVSPNGHYLKHDDFSNVLNSYTSPSPPYTKISRMVNKDSSVTVPAGTFNTINFQEKVTILDSLYTGNRIKYNNMVFADNVGMIFRNTCFYYGFNTIGVRLVRYHIEN